MYPSKLYRTAGFSNRFPGQLFICFLLIFFSVPLTAVELKNDTFVNDLRGWYKHEGELSREQDNGVWALSLAADPHSGTGRAIGNCRDVVFFPEDTFRIRLRAKGKGVLVCGIAGFPFGADSPRVMKANELMPLLIPGAELPLSSEWQDFTVECKVDDHKRQVYPYLEIRDGGRVLVESFSAESAEAAGVEVKALSGMQIVNTRDGANEVFFVSSLPEEPIYLSCHGFSHGILQKHRTAADGTVSFIPPLPQPGLWEAAASHHGKRGSFFIEMQEDTIYEATALTARKIHLERPLRALFIGDSLTDFDRGFNYVARLDFWLNKYNPGLFTFRNAGIGGDCLPWAEKRLRCELEKSGSAYRQEMYHGIFDEKFDLVFIFLGHNDTLSWRRDKYAAAATPPEQQKASLQAVYQMFRENMPEAQLILLAPSPSHEAMFLEHDRKLPPGEDMYMFGKRELVDAYDSVNRAFCREHEVLYIDILTPMRKTSDMAKLYIGDGIHLSLDGGRVIADIILSALAEVYPAH